MTDWTCLADELGLDSTGVLFANSERSVELTQGCVDAGYTPVQVDTTGVHTFRAAQAAIAEALKLPVTAGRNLDALADSLSDLAIYWPDSPRIALLWKHPESLILDDSEGWFRLVEVLHAAPDRLWHGDGDAADRLFETVVLIDGYDA